MWPRSAGSAVRARGRPHLPRRSGSRLGVFAAPGARDAAAPAPPPCAAPPPRPSASVPGPRARSPGSRALGASSAPGASQANSGRSALPRLLRGATRAAHWLLFIAHSFHWPAPRGGVAALSAARSSEPPPGLPPGELPPRTPRIPPTRPAARPGPRSRNLRPLDPLEFSPTLPPGGKLRQRAARL